MPDEFYWIGFSKKHQSSEWVWTNNHLVSTEDESLWGIGEPNNFEGQEHCGSSFFGNDDYSTLAYLGNDYVCSELLQGICEKLQ